MPVHSTLRRLYDNDDDDDGVVFVAKRKMTTYSDEDYREAMVLLKHYYDENTNRVNPMVFSYLQETHGITPKTAKHWIRQYKRGLPRKLRGKKGYQFTAADNAVLQATCQLLVEEQVQFDRQMVREIVCYPLQRSVLPIYLR